MIYSPPILQPDWSEVTSYGTKCMLYSSDGIIHICTIIIIIHTVFTVLTFRQFRFVNDFSFGSESSLCTTIIIIICHTLSLVYITSCNHLAVYHHMILCYS